MFSVAWRMLPIVMSVAMRRYPTTDVDENLYKQLQSLPGFCTL